jgi:hypothetical protein
MDIESAADLVSDGPVALRSVSRTLHVRRQRMSFTRSRDRVVFGRGGPRTAFGRRLRTRHPWRRGDQRYHLTIGGGNPAVELDGLIGAAVALAELRATRPSMAREGTSPEPGWRC